MEKTMKKENRKSGFYTRGFTTFVLAISFFLIAVTGVVLYVTPRGRVAHWTNWTVLGLGKEEWGAIHMTAATLFVITAAVHLFFNWKVILGYLRLKRIAGIRLKRELAAAVAVSLFVVVGTIVAIPPFGTIVDFHDAIKRSWDQAGARGPVAHAEELKLEELSERVEVPVEDVVGGLGARGYKGASPRARLSDIARANAVAPRDVYEAIRSEQTSTHRYRAESDTRGQGRGRMTLGELCSTENLSEDDAVELLGRQGIRAMPSSTLRELASSLQLRPGEIAAMLLSHGETTGRFDCDSSAQRPFEAR
jgi:hypothetical protein